MHSDLCPTTRAVLRQFVLGRVVAPYGDSFDEISGVREKKRVVDGSVSSSSSFCTK